MPDPRPGPRLEIGGIDYRYGNRVALSGVDLTVAPGVTTLLGPNGAGKTTLMRIVAGQLRPRAGAVTIDGLAMTRRSGARVGYLSQHPQVFGRFTCHEFVTYCAWLRGLSSRESRRRALEALDVVGLGDRRHDRAQTLSGGMRRRLCIAAVLSTRPDVVLLDEPMAGLDPEQQQDLREVITSLSDSSCVLVSTHVLHEVVLLADRVCLLHEGTVAFDGSISSFLGMRPEQATSEAVERAYSRWIVRTAGTDAPDPG